MANVDLFAVIAKELSCGKIDPALWSRAAAECDGSAERIKAEYIRLRHAALAAQSSTTVQTDQALPSASSTPVEIPPTLPVDGQTLQLRRDLRKELAAQGRKSLYSVLGCTPDVSDATIRARAQEIREQHTQAGTELPSEIRYALDTLSTPSSRASYDQKLMDQLGYSIAPVTPRSSINSDDSGGAFMGWWATRKVSVIIGVAAVLAIGYLLRGFVIARGNQEIAHRAADTARDAVHLNAANEAGRVQSERILAEGHVNNQARAIEVVSELGNRAIDVSERAEDRLRIEAQARANAIDAEAEARRVALEERHAASERAREQGLRDRDLAADERNREALRVQAVNKSISDEDFYTARQLAKSSSEHSRIDAAERAVAARQERIDAQNSQAPQSRVTSASYR